MSLERFPVRVRFNFETRSALDITSGSANASIWRGNDIVIDVGVYSKGIPLPLPNISSLTLQIKDKQNPTAAALAEVTVLAANLTASITDTGFVNGTEQHGSFIFTSAQTNLNLNNAASRTFWLVLSGLTTAGRSLTYGALTLTIHEDNAGVSTTPPTPVEEYYTKAEIDALFATFEGGGGGGPIEAADITDSGTVGRAVIQAETQTAAKAAVGLASVEDLAPADLPVSTLQAAALALKSDLVTPFIDLAGGTVLTFNRAHRDTIAANKNYTVPGSPSPTTGFWWRLNLTVTAPATITFPSSTLVGTDQVLNTLDLPVGDHELWNDFVGSKWIISHTVNADVSGVTGPVSVTAGRIVTWVSPTEIAEATVSVSDLQGADTTLQNNLTTGLAGKAPTVHTHAQGDITNLTADLAAKATKNVEFGADITATSYTFVLGDAHLPRFATHNTTPQTLTIPPESAVPFPLGTILFIVQGGTQAFTWSPGSGVTFMGGDYTSAGAGKPSAAYKFGANSWMIFGSLTT